MKHLLHSLVSREGAEKLVIFCYQEQSRGRGWAAGGLCVRIETCLGFGVGCADADADSEPAGLTELESPSPGMVWAGISVKATEGEMRVTLGNLIDNFKFSPTMIRSDCKLVL